MRADETRHAAQPLAEGGEEFPQPVKQVMRALAKVMTTTTYHL